MGEQNLGCKGEFERSGRWNLSGKQAAAAGFAAGVGVAAGLLAYFKIQREEREKYLAQERAAQEKANREGFSGALPKLLEDVDAVPEALSLIEKDSPLSNFIPESWEIGEKRVRFIIETPLLAMPITDKNNRVRHPLDLRFPPESEVVLLAEFRMRERRFEGGARDNTYGVVCLNKDVKEKVEFDPREIPKKALDLYTGRLAFVPLERAGFGEADSSVVKFGEFIAEPPSYERICRRLIESAGKRKPASEESGRAKGETEENLARGGE